MGTRGIVEAPIWMLHVQIRVVVSSTRQTLHLQHKNVRNCSMTRNLLILGRDYGNMLYRDYVALFPTKNQ